MKTTESTLKSVLLCVCGVVCVGDRAKGGGGGGGGGGVVCGGGCIS